MLRIKKYVPNIMNPITRGKIFIIKQLTYNTAQTVTITINIIKYVYVHNKIITSLIKLIITVS